jgi:crotonobetaine/carnitine-CoA ligase
VTERHTIPELLDQQARESPGREALVDLATGRALSYAQLADQVARAADGLQRLGVDRGDYVSIVLSNRIEHVICSYACMWIGAVHAAINAEFRGAALERSLALAGARVLVTEPAYLDALESAGVGREQVVLIGELASTRPAERAPVAASEPAVVLFTSGTTGHSKGCLLPHSALMCSAAAIVECAQLTEADCVFVPYPLFHMRAAFLDLLPALIVGGRAVLAPRFSASAFWEQVRAHEVTVFSLIGTVQQILWNREPSDGDRAHQVRLTWGAPTPVGQAEFKERFGIDVLPGDGVYGMSEIGIPCVSSLDADRHGRIRPMYELIVADEHDRPLPAGEIGEILVRPRQPGVIFLGYLNNPEATVGATRNLWFHTGDLGRLDEAGRLSFVGRRQERLRRAGHNISSWEVEEGLNRHPAVRASAVFGVPGALGEDDLAAAIVAADDSLTEDVLARFAGEAMAPFMVPQHFIFVDEIPMTATGKPAKSELADRLRATLDGR